jgi:RNA methyltransferase, TrmH family
MCGLIEKRKMAQLTPLPQAKASLIRKLLRDKQVRDSEGAFVLEGEKPIRELLRTHGVTIRMIVLTASYLKKAEPDFLRALHEQRTGERSASQTYVCPDEFFARLTDLQTPQGLLTVIEKPRWDERAILAKTPLLAVYGEQLQDPTNVGTLIRTAAAFGVDGLWLTPDSVDPFNPKVVRASAGAVMHVPVLFAPDAAHFLTHGCTLFAAEPTHIRGQDLRDVTQLPAKTVVALGNESRGLRPATLKHATTTFHISTNPAVESLNVASAAAICLFYLTGLRLR